MSVVQIRHFLYNSFLLQHGNTKIAIDPGQNLWLLGLHSLIPKSEWPLVSHVLVTHGDPDHYWQADRLASTASAPLVVHKSMIKEHEGTTWIIAPRKGGLKFVPYDGPVVAIESKQTLMVDGLEIQAIGTVHGPIEFKVLGMTVRKNPGPKERAGFGSVGYRIKLGGKTLVNLGDSLLMNDWQGLMPDVLMLPIGGLGNRTWTMDAVEALEAVKVIKPRLVIPCHYSVPFLWKRKMAVADDLAFKRGVEALGVECRIMHHGDAITV